MDAPVGENLISSGLARHGKQGTSVAQRKILLFSSTDGDFAPMIASRFVRLHFAVDALCPGNHVLACSAAVARVFRYGFARPLRNLRAAIEASRPDLIIPCDDPARYALTKLHGASARRDDPKSIETRTLIERSLGQRAHLGLAEEKSRLLATLADSGVRLPLTLPIASAEALEEACQRLKYPVVLKRDRTFGGMGVVICRSREEAACGYQRLTSRPTMRDTLRQIFRKADFWAITNHFAASHPAVTAQAYIGGRPANRAVGCWEGKVVAGLTVVALKTNEDNPVKPATVVQIVHNEEIDRMAAIVVKGLGLSGICGLDFMIETGTDLPYFIELNPRATPTCHLGRACETDICTALHYAIEGTLPDDGIAMEDLSEPIALFPGELRRDPRSPYLSSGYHAVPWDDPKVLMQILRQPRGSL